MYRKIAEASLSRYQSVDLGLGASAGIGLAVRYTVIVNAACKLALYSRASSEAAVFREDETTSFQCPTTQASAIDALVAIRISSVFSASLSDLARPQLQQRICRPPSHHANLRRDSVFAPLSQTAHPASYPCSLLLPHQQC